MWSSGLWRTFLRNTLYFIFIFAIHLHLRISPLSPRFIFIFAFICIIAFHLRIHISSSSLHFISKPHLCISSSIFLFFFFCFSAFLHLCTLFSYSIFILARDLHLCISSLSPRLIFLSLSAFHLHLCISCQSCIFVSHLRVFLFIFTFVFHDYQCVSSSSRRFIFPAFHHPLSFESVPCRV